MTAAAQPQMTHDPTRVSPRNYRQLSHAMRLLAGRCDGAAAQDGQGFNKLDTGFGHVLADTSPSRWSPKMAQAAHRMAIRYRRQLAAAGIDIEAIETPDSTDRRPGKRQPSGERVTAFEATITGDLVELSAPGFPGQAAVAAVKAIPGRKFTKKPRPIWRVPLAAASALLRVMADGHIQHTPELAQRLREQIRRQAVAAEASTKLDADLSVSGLGGELLPFQRAGVAYAVEHRRCFIADQMGLGKTVQALATLQATGCFPALIVVPASVKLNWEREARKWLPRVRRIEVLSGRKPVPLPADVGIVIINHDVLAAWQSTLARWAPKGLIFDESHYLKSAKAQRTKAAKAISRAGGGELCLLLTGTPILNGTPSELISQLQIIDRLRDVGGYKTFVDSYCIRGYWGGFERGGRNLEELNARMRSVGAYIRRLKADVLTELPAKRRVRVPLELRHKARYEAALASVAKRLRAAAEERKQARREAREPEGWARAAAVVGITTLRQAAAQCKLPAALDWLRDMLESGEKLVIFAHHTETVEAMAAALGCPMIRGGVSAEARQAAVDQFQTDPETRAIVLNLKAGGVGLTLTAASNVVFMESGWTPADNDQAEDRCHRIGQSDSVTAWYLEAAPIDAWLADLIEQKRSTVDAITDGSGEERASVIAELEQLILGAA